MKLPLRKFIRRLKKVSGATLFEYTIVLSLVAVVCVLLVRTIGTKTTNSMEPVNTVLEQ